MRKQEAALTAVINRWFALIVPQSSPWEVKHTRGGNRFRMAELKEHQRNFLFAATTPTGCTWKIPDLGDGYAPFDTIHYKNTPAYVLIAFPKMLVAIEIRDMPFDKSSITEEEALRLSLWSCLVSTLGR